VAIATPASWAGITFGFRFARRLRFLPAFLIVLNFFN
jgi:hypothetical protein